MSGTGGGIQGKDRRHRRHRTTSREIGKAKPYRGLQEQEINRKGRRGRKGIEGLWDSEEKPHRQECLCHTVSGGAIRLNQTESPKTQETAVIADIARHRGEIPPQES
jgi:hypothetical protein